MPTLSMDEILANADAEHEVEVPHQGRRRRVAPKIPKTIWTFWHNDDPPQFIRECINGWKRTNPDYSVTLITPDTMPKYILMPLPIVSNQVKMQHLSDWVRLSVLRERGGVWVDPSVIITGSLRPLFAAQERCMSEEFCFHGNRFTTDESKPVIESWFIATVQCGKYISQWFNEFNVAFANFGMDDRYLDYLKFQYGEDGYRRILQGNTMPHDLKLYIASQTMLEMRPNEAKPPLSVAAEEDPFLLIYEEGWDCSKFARRLLLPWPVDKRPPLLTQLEQPAREEFLKLLESGDLSPDPSSIYAKYAKLGGDNLETEIIGLKKSSS